MLHPSGERVWVIYHFDMQPYEIRKACWVVDHIEENCKRLAQEHRVEAMIESEFADYILTEEGKKILAAYIIDEDVNSNMDTTEGSLSAVTNSNPEIDFHSEG